MTLPRLAPAAALLLTGAVLADTAEVRVIAVTGDPAAGLAGTEFTSFSLPLMNSAGKVAFSATTSSPIVSSGMWATPTDDPQSLDIIVGRNYVVPGASGNVRFDDLHSSFFDPLVNDNGNVGFSARLVGDGMPEDAIGLFREIDGVLESVALPGGSVPGLADGVTWTQFNNLVSFNNNDALCFRGAFEGPGVNDTNNAGVFSHWFGGLSMYARKGGAAPGVPGATIEQLHFVGPQINDDGQIMFTADMTGASEADAVFRGWPGLITPVLAEGDETPLGDTVTGLASGFWGAHQSTEGAVAPANVSGGDGTLGLFFASEGGLETIAQEGEWGPLGLYTEIPSYVGANNSDGTTVFLAAFALDPSEDTAIIRKARNQAGEVVIREGDHAYSYGAGVTIQAIDQSYSAMQIDDEGRVFYAANVAGPGVTEANDRALYMFDANGDTHLVVREGQFIQAAPGDWRQIESFVHKASPGVQANRSGAVGGNGDIAFRVQFTDDSQAVVVGYFTPSCSADLNEDGFVNAEDLAILLAFWGQPGPIGDQGDVDHDGDTDAGDLAALLAAWGACLPM